MHTTRNWNAAALSLLVPGWGQFEQRRTHAGRLFLVWAGLACGVALVTLSQGLPAAIAGLELGLVTVWSAADALLVDVRS